MDQSSLHSGLSLWQAIGPPPLECSALDGDLSCEVAVVGGGITGTLVSYYLVKSGVETVLVEREDLGRGSTAASTGLLQYEVDTPLAKLIERVGQEHAVHAYRRGLEAVDELERLVADLEQLCGFARRSTLCLASDPAHVAELQREYECRRYFEFDVRYFERGGLLDYCGLEAPAATYSRGDGQLDPYSLTRSLLKAACSQGLRIFHRTAVEATSETPSHVTLSTPHGRITARAAIFTTGYASHEFLPFSPGTLNTTYAMASHPIAPPAQWPERCLIWETSRPYFYARQTEDGRALIGGADTTGPYHHCEDELLAAKSRRLARRFCQIFPGCAFEPAYVWAGTFAETKDGLPYIGAPLGHERVLFALAYGGNGITFGMIAARLLADLFMKRPNKDAVVFRFGR